MARFYANENFPLPVVERLRDLGHDVLTVLETGNAGQSILDEDVLALAIGDQRSVLTFNRRHFIRLHRGDPNHAGIVVCTFDPDFLALADRIDHDQPLFPARRANSGQSTTRQVAGHMEP